MKRCWVGPILLQACAKIHEHVRSCDSRWTCRLWQLSGGRWCDLHVNAGDEEMFSE